jgi:hypothetical protein
MRVQLLKVFLPDTSDTERRQLAAAVPPAVRANPNIYEPFAFGELRDAFNAHLPPGKNEYRKVMWEGVRQLVGALGFGDLLDAERRNAVFDVLDRDRDGKVRQQFSLLPHARCLACMRQRFQRACLWTNMFCEQV